MAIRLVAVDVDGTLVTADQRVLPRVQAAAQRALEHGIQLVCAPAARRESVGIF